MSDDVLTTEHGRSDSGRLRYTLLLYLLISIAAVSVGTFVGGFWAAAGIGGGILLFGTTWFAHRKAPQVDPTMAGFVAAMILLIAALNFHALDHGVAWHLLLQQMTIVIPLMLLSSPQLQAGIDDRRVFLVVAIAASVCALAIGVELALNAPVLHDVEGLDVPLTRYNRGASYLAVFAFPLASYLWVTGRRWQTLIFIGIMLVPADLTESRATKAALILGSATTIAAFAFPIVARRTLAAVLLVLLSFPLAVTQLFDHDQAWIRHLPSSWQHRIEIWDYMSYRIFERPFLGWGLGSSKYLPYMEPHGASYQFIKEAAGHPHDAILQLWVELGVGGLLLGVVFALLMLRRAGGLPRHVSPFALGAWVAALCVSLVSYNFWDDSLFSLFALTALAFERVGALVPAAGVSPLPLPGQQPSTALPRPR